MPNDFHHASSKGCEDHLFGRAEVVAEDFLERVFMALQCQHKLCIGSVNLGKLWGCHCRLWRF